MRCTKCNKKLRKAYYINGKPYGPECAREKGYSDRKVVIKKSVDDEKQIELF